jgi:glycosyltransferase involved in cell wall biosynthesis
MLPPLTVAIPTYSRWTFLRTLIPKLLSYNQVKHVVVCDDGGGDAMAIWSEAWGNHEKLHVYINEKRLGIFANKRKCLEMSPTPWVVLLDSDNEYTKESFEFLEEFGRTRDLDARVIYAAAGMERLENGSVDRPLAAFGDLEISSANWKYINTLPKSNELLNDGNFLINTAVLEHIPVNVPNDRYYAADVIAWLDILINGQGWTYRVLKGLSYRHNVHNDSSWLEMAADSWNAMKKIKGI